AHADIMKAPTEGRDHAESKRVHLSRLKKGIIKTKQASRKNTDPNIAQKLPMDAMQNPIAEITNRIQPVKLMR
ncbi:MAG: hypothetical protein V7695_16055, partial [Sulfitobacter sp.]